MAKKAHKKPATKSKPTSRRNFLKKAVGASAAVLASATALSAQSAEATPEPVPAFAAAPEVAPSTELAWTVYATCPECNGIVNAATLGADANNQMRDAEGERIRAAGFNAFKARQAKTFDTGYRLKKDCKHSHEFPVN